MITWRPHQIFGKGGFWTVYSFNFPQMLSDLPYDIIDQIIDTVEGKDTNLLKELPPDLLQISICYCRPLWRWFKKGIRQGTCKSRPDVLSTISAISSIKWTIAITSNNIDHQLSHMLPNFLRTISRLNCLAIDVASESGKYWDLLDSFPVISVSLPHASFYHLSHRPTSHLSQISHCLVSLHVSICFGLIYKVSSHLKRLLCSRGWWCPKIREFHNFKFHPADGDVTC